MQMKTFNITGTCFPAKHYMVDIQERLDIIRGMVERGDYFCINRGRQYGKTTTLKALYYSLSNDYAVFQLSFEGLGDSAFVSLDALSRTLINKLWCAVDFEKVSNIDKEVKTLLEDAAKDTTFNSEALSILIQAICNKNSKPIILLIDEVDQAGNWDSFLQLLGLLRTLYLDRDVYPTFQSVILAGVYDIKNLKLKIRPESEHQYNSPWNIAAPFDVDMSLSRDGIEGMLKDYEQDHHTGMDTGEIATMLREYTAGYPFLVSRLCQLMDGEKEWTREGFLKAEKKLQFEKNTLFDDLNKKVEQFPEMRKMLEDILYRGQSYAYNPNSSSIELATMFGFIRNNDGQVAIANRIFETLLYEKFVAEDVLHGSKMYSESILQKPDFTHDGQLDMPLILSRFVKTFREVYGDTPETFLEDEGRRLFMLFIKPIINGTGNYYIEAQTRNGLRTDLIIDYLGKRYIVEMKIWRGNAYNERGEKQLAEYLERYDEPVGYMVSFCFNKNKQPGLKPAVKVGGKELIEAVV